MTQVKYKDNNYIRANGNWITYDEYYNKWVKEEIIKQKALAAKMKCNGK